MTRQLGTVIVLSGPSGVGKSTLVGRLREAMPELEFSISCTTRPPRRGEIDHVHYHFLDDAAFEQHLAAGDFLEHAGVFSRRYGTLKSEIYDRVCDGRDVLLDIDVQGAMQIRECAAADPLLKRVCEFIFIGPPSVEALETRLRGRSTDSEEQILLRLAGARRELSFYDRYDYLIINDQLDVAAARLESVVRGFRTKVSRLEERLFE
ncbi:MAG: guanylate kinase [Lentisphaeria bacterium]|nr:guanylate kinase [Lentisphaeria bacterium]